MLCRPTAAGTASAPTGSGGFRSLNGLSGLVSAAASTFGMRMLFCRDRIGTAAARATAAATRGCGRLAFVPAAASAAINGTAG